MTALRKLERYRQERRCPKCRGFADTHYVPADLMKRECANCGHIWFEEPLDKGDRS